MDVVAAVLLRIVNRSNRKRIIVFEGWIERTSLMYDGHQLNDIMNSTTSKIFNDDEEQTSTSLFEGETLRFHMEAPPFYLSLPYNFTKYRKVQAERHHPLRIKIWMHQINFIVYALKKLC